MDIVYYPVILGFCILLIWIFSKRKLENETTADPVEESKYKWSIVIKSKGKLYKGLEDDDLGKVGYYIYQNFATKLDQIDVYVKDNQNNEILMIQKTYESECMIGVDHPEQGHRQHR
ncbi:hypothetical protein EON65_19155, partial [archaeon]